MAFEQLLKYWAYNFLSPEKILKAKYSAFKKILHADRRAHLFMARLEQIFYEKRQVDCSVVELIYQQLSEAVADMVFGLLELAPGRYSNLKDYYKKIDFYCRLLLAPMNFNTTEPYIFLPGEGPADENLLGGKGVHLHMLHEKLRLPVPSFFIVTTNAFCHFLDHNCLIPKLNTILAEVDIQDPVSLENTSKKILKILKSAEIPEIISAKIKKAVERFSLNQQNRTHFSVRSSAVAEDRESSFAGQYLTILGVNADQVLPSYKNILLSKYNPSPVYYRIKKGYCDQETPMAVIVQEMIETKTAGVAYSRNPDNPEENCLVIYSARGLGERVVSGSVTPDVIKVDRETLATEAVCHEANNRGHDKSTLKMEEIQKLASWVLAIEDYLGRPADMEWCLDKKGNLLVLQARPFTLPAVKKGQRSYLNLSQQKILIEGGIPAATGCGTGRVHRISTHEDLAATPFGSVLVARQAPPDFVEIFERVSAIITEKGSAASHCASVAREIGIPFLCNVTSAMDKLEEGLPVTVDADNRRIYMGIAQECNQKKAIPKKSRSDEDSPLYNKLKQLIKMVSQLSLMDVNSEKFRPEGCRSLHDIIRFVHECAMREMFFLGGESAGPRRGAKRLKSSLPLTFYVLDVGGGLKIDDEQLTEITPDHILSAPMKAFWKGLSHPSVRWSQMEHFAWGDYDAVMLAGGIMNKDAASLASYAVLAGDYMNLSIRFGYHFVQIDALATGLPNNNYITFRFSGGGGDAEGKFMRTKFIAGILQRLGFKAETTGDLVDARIKHVSEKEVLSVLFQVGRLVGATRLMDMMLTPETDIERLIAEFLQGRSDFSQNFQGTKTNGK
ncbi:MAG: hypothetical protein DSZ23_00085 [Thermodesulfatator sp.]|nr:MAG: hypothetical protein DSZ23_00085 [Thermodesulfatator sp.]